MTTTTASLFDDDAPPVRARQVLGPGALLLPGFALDRAEALLQAVERVQAQAPLRHLVTPGGLRMSVAMTNCGRVGWVSDRSGYRYDPLDPDSGRPWPAMPEVLHTLAADAARAAGYDGYAPDACLVNQYVPGTRLSLHQDRDERDHGAPIVSVSLGLPAVFLFGGPKRADRPVRHALFHGDVVVWGGASRLYFHGVAALAEGVHPVLGARRVNLTFRKAL